MVKLFVSGNVVGTLADAEKVIAAVIGKNQSVEFRDDAGAVVGTFVPNPVAARADDPDWVKAITPEEIARRMAGEFVTFDELKKRLGWQ